MLPLVGGGAHTSPATASCVVQGSRGAWALCWLQPPVQGWGWQGAHRGAPTELLPRPQSRSDFIGGRVEVALSLPRQEQCLSLAVLDMLRIAKEKRQSPDEVFNCVR